MQMRALSLSLSLFNCGCRQKRCTSSYSYSTNFPPSKDHGWFSSFFLLVIFPYLILHLLLLCSRGSPLHLFPLYAKMFMTEYLCCIREERGERRDAALSLYFSPNRRRRHQRRSKICKSIDSFPASIAVVAVWWEGKRGGKRAAGIDRGIQSGRGGRGKFEN